MTKVAIVSWTPVLKKISLTHLIRDAEQLGLRSAKSKTDDLLLGLVPTIELPDRDSARLFASRAAKVGAVCFIDPKEHVISAEEARWFVSLVNSSPLGIKDALPPELVRGRTYSLNPSGRFAA